MGKKLPKLTKRPPYLTIEQKKEIKEMWVAGFQNQEIAKKFGKDPSCIHRVLGNTDTRPEKLKKRLPEQVFNEIKIQEKILENTEKILEILLKIERKFQVLH